MQCRCLDLSCLSAEMHSKLVSPRILSIHSAIMVRTVMTKRLNNYMHCLIKLTNIWTKFKPWIGKQRHDWHKSGPGDAISQLAIYLGM